MRHVLAGWSLLVLAFLAGPARGADVARIRELYWQSSEWWMRANMTGDPGRMSPEAADALEKFMDYRKAVVPILLDYYEEVWREGGLKNWTYTKSEWHGIDKGGLCSALQSILRAKLDINLHVRTDPEVPWGGPPEMFREWWNKYGQYREWREDGWNLERKAVRALRTYLKGIDAEVATAAAYLNDVLVGHPGVLGEWIHNNADSGDAEKARMAQLGRLCLGEVYGVRVSKDLPPYQLWRRGMTLAEEEAHERAKQVYRAASDVFDNRQPVKRWQDIDRAGILAELAAPTTGLTPAPTGTVP